VDVWSLSVTFYLLYCGEFPFFHTDQQKFMELAEHSE
jgi:serine/threonine protein kinase